MAALAAYRIIQESLTNALGHAPGAPVTVEVTFGSERMSILVQNPSARRARDVARPACIRCTRTLAAALVQP